MVYLRFANIMMAYAIANVFVCRLCSCMSVTRFERAISRSVRLMSNCSENDLQLIYTTQHTYGTEIHVQDVKQEIVSCQYKFHKRTTQANKKTLNGYFSTSFTDPLWMSSPYSMFYLNTILPQSLKCKTLQQKLCFSRPKLQGKSNTTCTSRKQTFCSD